MQDRILFFLKLPPPLTGATLMNMYVAESLLLKDNFKLKLIPISYKTKIEDVSVFSLHKILIICRLYIRLIIALLKYKPKVIYFQISPVGLAFFRDCTYIFIMKLFRKHILYHMHGKGIKEFSSDNKLIKLVYSWAFRNSSVICLSELLLIDLKDIYSGNPFIVNNCIPYNSLLEYQKKFDSTIRILFLSNIIVSKGIFDFLDALKILNDKVLSNAFEGIIIGKETDIKTEKLQNAISEREIQNNVFYLGAKYNEEKNELIASADILVHPTFKDVWGLVILEAMQAGIPVIATREGAIPEIIDDGVTGFLVDKHSPDQIAEKLEILINSPELRKKMGAAGRKKFLEKYTLEIFENNMKNVFNNVLDNLSSK